MIELERWEHAHRAVRLLRWSELQQAPALKPHFLLLHSSDSHSLPKKWKHSARIPLWAWTVVWQDDLTFQFPFNFRNSTLKFAAAEKRVGSELGLCPYPTHTCFTLTSAHILGTGHISIDVFSEFLSVFVIFENERREDECAENQPRRWREANLYN